MRSVAAAARFDQIAQNGDHLQKLFGLALKFVDVLGGQAANTCIAALLVTPQGEQRLDPIHGEAQLARAFYEPQSMDVFFSIVAVAAFAATWLRQQADRLVVADHFRGNAGPFGCFSNVHLHDSGMPDLTKVGSARKGSLQNHA